MKYEATAKDQKLRVKTPTYTIPNDARSKANDHICIYLIQLIHKLKGYRG